MFRGGFDLTSRRMRFSLDAAVAAVGCIGLGVTAPDLDRIAL